MVKEIVHRILIFSSILAFANSAKCYRSSNTIQCENADKKVIERLVSYYESDRSLIVKNSSIPILESGIFEGLKFIEKFSFTTCEIRVLQNGVFRGLNLTHLNLARNFLKDIPKNIFDDLINLKFLDLSYNYISNLELKSEIGYLPKLNYIDVSNNQLKNFTMIGNFSELETVNFENNTLTKFQLDLILHLPNIKNVFFDGNLLHASETNFTNFVLTNCNITINSKNTFYDDGWNAIDNTTKHVNTTAMGQNEPARNDIEKDFRLSPELIKSLNRSQLTNLVERILILKNFTENERQELETDRRRIGEEVREVKRESSRLDELLKRLKEVAGEAIQESFGEYIEKTCQGMPDDTWWRRFKKWSCKKLYNWVKGLSNRQ